jgi:hypothetical protein
LPAAVARPGPGTTRAGPASCDATVTVFKFDIHTEFSPKLEKTGFFSKP